MAKTRSRTIERPQTDAELDDSSDHPALTPLMRRLAREQCYARISSSIMAATRRPIRTE